MKTPITSCILVAFAFLPAVLLSQGGNLTIAVDDSICIMPGQNLVYNVTSNDVLPPTAPHFVFLTTPDSVCFDLKNTGELVFSGNLEECCGEHILQYRYEGCQPPSKCFARIKIIVKCQKPDCFFVNMDDYASSDGAGVPPQCAFACEHSASTYFTGYDPNSTYVWNVTGGTFVPGANPAAILVTWGAMGSGSVSVTVTDANNVVTDLDVCVDILQSPVAAFTVSDDSICLNSPVNFMNNSVGGSTWFWDFGDGGTSTMFNATHTYTTPGNYTACLYVTRNNFDAEGNALCCCSDTTCVDIVVDSLPGPNIYCVSTLCAGDSSKYWTDATNCGTYNWSVLDENGLPLPFTGQGTDTICVQWGTGPFGTVVLEVANCDSTYCDGPVSITVPIISPTTAISGDNVVCENSVATYTVPKWMSVYYNWQVSGAISWTGQGTNTITVQWGAAPGPGIINLQYYSSFLGGLPGHDPEDCGGMASLTVAIKPAFDITAPPSPTCVNTSSTFFATATPSATYTWTVTPTAPFTGQGTNSITVNWTTGPGNYVITAVPTNPAAYCNGIATATMRVVEVQKPDAITGPIEICPGISYTYFGQTTQTGVGFVWTITGGTPASATGNPVMITWNPTGPYAIGLQNSLLNAPFCPSDSIQLKIKPKLINGPLTITGPPACINTTQNYIAGPAQHPEATYNWAVSPATMGSVVGGQGTPNAQIQWNNTGGSATLILNVSLCSGSQAISIPVTLNAPVVPVITQTGILCPGVMATLNAGAGFTSYQWSPSGNTQTISISSGGTYLVTTTDANGCTAIDTYQAVAQPGPVAAISTPDPNHLCIVPPNSNTVTILAQTGVGYTFNWFCNGTPQVLPPTQATFTHTNTNVQASFAYWVKVTDANGCMNTSNVIPVVQDSCKADTLCVPQPYTLSFTAANQMPNCNIVDFTVSASGNVTLTGWDFNDPLSNANTGTLANAQHVYQTVGCTKVYLYGSVPEQAPGTGMCPVEYADGVCIPLVADFIYTDSCGKVTFTDKSTFLPGENPVTWAWSFGSTQQDPMHVFPGPGAYSVTLTVTNANGCQASITKTVLAGGAVPPGIIINPSPACVGDPFSFSGSGANIINWLWKFGDGSFNGAQNPSHSYLSSGSYNVMLTVVDANGCQSMATQTLLVNPAVPPAVISVAPSLIVCAGTNVTLTAPAGYTYVWSNFATTQSIVTSVAGTYSVIITDVNGCSRVLDPVTVVILPPPTAAISGNPVICDAGCTTLSATAGQGYTYQWLDNLGNPIPGEVSQTLNVCDFNLLPSYSVVVTDANGCTAVSAPVVVSVKTSPSFSIAISPDDCEGMPVTLSVTPVQPNVVYGWSNGASGPVITVIQAGTYIAIGTDTTSGCSFTASATIHPLPDLCLVPAGCYKACNPDTICGPDGLAGYQWNLNGVPITGANGQCLVVTQSGTYTLTGTTSFGCSATSDSLILMLMDCSCGNLTVSAEPVSDSCCWTLSYSNPSAVLYGVVIHSSDTDFNFDLGSLDPSLSVFSIGANTISLVNSTTNAPLPTGALPTFLRFCLENIQNTPQQVIFDWYDFDFNIACSDTLELNCPNEPDCLYVQHDSIYCDGGQVVYTMTVCNPIDNDFSVGYIVMQPVSPAGVIMTPSTIDETANPIAPGDCRTYTILLSGPNLAEQTFCFTLMAHDEKPELIDTTHCCSLDTIYCIDIPDCNPCDDIGVEEVLPFSTSPSNQCCYSISLFNNYAAGYFDGIGLCMLSGGTVLTMNNPFGSGWVTASYTPTMIVLNAAPPLGTSLPLGVFQLPDICIRTDQAPPQLLEIKWMQGDSIVCRDTIPLTCEPPCGYISGENIVCDPAAGTWVYQGTIKNTSNTTMGEAHIVFTSPAGLSIYNQTIPLGAGLPPNGTQTFSVVLGPPAAPGDTICFTVALHALDDNDQHTNCCNFEDCIVLPECAVPLDCACEDLHGSVLNSGISYVTAGNIPYTATFTPDGALPCDDVYWYWPDVSGVQQSSGTQAMMHTFPGLGKYTVCAYIFRSDDQGQQCSVEICKTLRFSPAQDDGTILIIPNPSGGEFTVQTTSPWQAPVQLRLYDLQGRVVKEWTAENAAGESALKVWLDNTPKGMYLLEIVCGGEKRVEKVVIE
ncbi:MAG: PKD domain-containing protein [Bacteroidetes bacterium]|nr:PKD domain-containing protein [Bacteroidota bacterium]